MRWILSLCPLYKSRLWDPENISNLPMVTQLVSGWTGIWTSQLDFRVFLLTTMLRWLEIILFQIFVFYKSELLQVCMWSRTILGDVSGPKWSQVQTVEKLPLSFSLGILLYSFHFSDVFGVHGHFLHSKFTSGISHHALWNTSHVSVILFLL